MTAPLPDALPTNWVDRHAPAWAQPWLKLGRFDRPTGIWLLMLPGWQGIALAHAARGEAPSLSLLALFFLGAALMRAAGCAYNDIVDRDIDAKVARTAGRPIPAGQITVRQAWVFIAICCGLSLAILLSFNRTAQLLGVASLALVAAGVAGADLQLGRIAGLRRRRRNARLARAAALCERRVLDAGLRHHLRRPGPRG